MENVQPAPWRKTAIGASRWGKDGGKYWLCIDAEGVRDSFEYFDTKDQMEARAIEVWGKAKWLEICRIRNERFRLGRFHV